MIVHCSNIEQTAADALFFESLLWLARTVVAAAVADPSLASEVRELSVFFFSSSSTTPCLFMIERCMRYDIAGAPTIHLSFLRPELRYS